MSVFNFDFITNNLTRLFKFEKIPKALEIHENRLIIDDKAFDLEAHT